jgi:LysR family transcriptional regulator, cyn operon transcriptional activator
MTDAGSAYVEYVRRALRDLDAGQRAIHDVRDLSRGQLRLAVTPTFTA